MEHITLGDWPLQPVDLTLVNTPWIPAYGFQTPSTISNDVNFNDNPDGECFRQGQLTYLETILEETPDDLRSESEVDARDSSIGWLSSNSENSSVIYVAPADDNEIDFNSEVACPVQNRTQEYLMTSPIEDSELNSLSRSSSLLQFETLEKQCQETGSNSPSTLSQFSSDSNRKNGLRPDSLNNLKSDSMQVEVVNTKTQKTDVSNYETKLSELRTISRVFASSDCDVILGNNKEKISAGNLSEDSGYSDMKLKMQYNLKRKSSVFSAYDGDVSQEVVN